MKTEIQMVPRHMVRTFPTQMQMETMLFRIIRGTGIQGLSAMQTWSKQETQQLFSLGLPERKKGLREKGEADFGKLSPPTNRAHMGAKRKKERSKITFRHESDVGVATFPSSCVQQI